MIALRCALCFGAIALSSHAFAAEVRFQDLMTQCAMTQCAACHGVNGIARDVEVPNLAGSTTATSLISSRRSGQASAHTRKSVTSSRQLTDEEMTAISQYYANMPH